jgi:hypothetical protein
MMGTKYACLGVGTRFEAHFCHSRSVSSFQLNCWQVTMYGAPGRFGTHHQTPVRFSVRFHRQVGTIVTITKNKYESKWIVIRGAMLIDCWQSVEILSKTHFDCNFSFTNTISMTSSTLFYQIRIWRGIRKLFGFGKFFVVDYSVCFFFVHTSVRRCFNCKISLFIIVTGCYNYII